MATTHHGIPSFATSSVSLMLLHLDGWLRVPESHYRLDLYRPVKTGVLASFSVLHQKIRLIFVSGHCPSSVWLSEVESLNSSTHPRYPIQPLWGPQCRNATIRTICIETLVLYQCDGGFSSHPQYLDSLTFDSIISPLALVARLFSWLNYCDDEEYSAWMFGAIKGMMTTIIILIAMTLICMMNDDDGKFSAWMFGAIKGLQNVECGQIGVCATLQFLNTLHCKSLHTALHCTLHCSFNTLHYTALHKTKLECIVCHSTMLLNCYYIALLSHNALNRSMLN